jgi:hypothetical protein
MCFGHRACCACPSPVVARQSRNHLNDELIMAFCCSLTGFMTDCLDEGVYMINAIQRGWQETWDNPEG